MAVLRATGLLAIRFTVVITHIAILSAMLGAILWMRPAAYPTWGHTGLWVVMIAAMLFATGLGMQIADLTGLEPLEDAVFISGAVFAGISCVLVFIDFIICVRDSVLALF